MDEKIVQADVLNGNGRKYPREVLEQIVDAINTRTQNGHAVFGELEPPRDPLGNINLANISHVVSDARIQEGWLVVDVRVLKTPMGGVLEVLNAETRRSPYSVVKPSGAFRPRGTGKIAVDGTVSDYQFITIDYVGNPA